MGRVIHIIIYSIFFILIFLALAGIYEGCHKDKLGQEGGPELQRSAQDSQETDGLENIASEFFEDSATEAANDPEDETESPNQNLQKTEIDVPEEEAAEKKTPSPAVPARNSRSSSADIAGSDQYLVIAGSFGIKANAENMVTRLKSMGYSKAYLFNFDGSNYFTVSASSHANMVEARSATTELKQKGIDSYVHVRQK